MPDGAIETVTIAEAAALLGVHRNTVRNRIKAGRYRAHKLISAQGETYAIERDSLGLPPHNRGDNAAQSQGRHNAPNGAQPGSLAGADMQAQQLAVVQRLLAPFVQELAATNAELGRVQERLSVAERERDALAAQMERVPQDEEKLTTLEVEVASRVAAVAPRDAAQRTAIRKTATRSFVEALVLGTLAAALFEITTQILAGPWPPDPSAVWPPDLSMLSGILGVFTWETAERAAWIAAILVLPVMFWQTRASRAIRSTVAAQEAPESPEPAGAAQSHLRPWWRFWGR